MEKSIVVHDENHEPMMVNEADMDFRIPGLPHSVVKHAQSTSVRELILKIENHPDRHPLADEDHTHHLTPQKYYHYKSDWWLHSNKQGSNTVQTTHRSDFKQALSTLQQLKQKEEEAL